MRALFDHLSLGVSDLARSQRFYDAVLAPLGIVGRATVDGEIGYTFAGSNPTDASALSFFIGFEDPTAKRTVVPSAGFHLAFRASSRAEVEAFHAAALRAGGADNGAPGLRPQYHPSYYGAFVLDPDGHHIEAVCFESAG